MFNICRKTKLTITILVTALLCGCASTVNLQPNDRLTTKTIYIDPKIGGPKILAYSTSDTRLPGTIAGGLVGTMLSGIASAHGVEQFNELTQENNIKIEDIVYNAFVKNIKRRNQFRIADPHSADAKLVIEIYKYGIVNYSTFTYYVHPELTLHAKLIKQGKIIWEKDGFDTTMFGTDEPSYKIAELFRHPQYLKEIWDFKANKIISKLVDEM
jgi:hypothetical protein